MTQIKLTIYGIIVLAIVVIAGLGYWRGSSNATTKADLKAARQTINTERATLKITTETTDRVNSEAIKTITTAKGATDEIDTIRRSAPRTPAVQVSGDQHSSTPVDALDAGDARIVQLAREARAAAVASSAKLQPASTGTR